jgi:hypothetical protein
VETLQLIIALPVLVIALLAALQFAVLELAHAAVTHAAAVAVREAGKGADADTLEQVVNAVLAPHQVTIGANASVVLEHFGMPPQQRGTLPCGPPPGPPIGPGEVRVTVCVDLTTFPLLVVPATFGLDFSGKRLEITAISPVE